MNTTKVPTWEAHLVARATTGDSVAFDLLIDLHRPMLTSLAMRMLRNTDDAYDAVQDTLVKAYRAIRDFDSGRPVKPWLCRICTNCCVDTVRYRRRAGEPLENHEHLIADTSVDIDAFAHEKMEQEMVAAAIDRLPEKYRKILVMRHFEHLEVNEIADRLEKPEGTVKSWLFRARALLRKELQPA